MARCVCMVMLSVSVLWADDVNPKLQHDLAWQMALETVDFSPGIIDGVIGRKTELATREFQRIRALKQTGQLDALTSQALGIDPNHVLEAYQIKQSDLDQIGPCPTSWVEKSKLKQLGYGDLEEVLAEKFHCTRGLLRRLNPGVTLNDLKVGDRLMALKFVKPGKPSRGATIQINLSQKVIRVIDQEQRLVGLFHCSIAASKEKRPTGQATIKRIVTNPEYTFWPEMWPEVTEQIDQALRIPPGPRNPVGCCWIALSLPGYGIHGTPHPELIGKTGSHGCIRMTNWDALRLSKMVKTGTVVEFVE